MPVLMSRPPRAAEAITGARLMAHVRALCAPEMRGRMPGDAGYERASRYVEDVFAGLGLEPLGREGSFRQPFELETVRIRAARAVCERPGRPARELALGTDFVCRCRTGAGRVAGPLAFVGYGTSDGPVDELAGIDLVGKVAVAFKFAPPWHEGEAPLPRERGRLLAALGAVALVLVPNPNREAPDRLGASWVESGRYLPGFPLIVLDGGAARELLDLGDETLASLQWRIDQRHEPASRPLPGRMEIEIEVDHDPRGVCWNVLARLPGSDPALAPEAVVLGAHLDHTGIQAERVVFHGAQDDASGVAAVLESAACLAAGPRPRRSVVFAAFGAEEAGILGSLAYASDPPVPLARTVAMLNADCVGAGTGLDLLGRRDWPHLFEIVDALNAERIGLPDLRRDRPGGGADAEPFQRAGVPNIYFMTSLPWQHLHLASDLPETLNPPVFERVTRLFCLTAAVLAD